MNRARAAQVVASALEAMGTAQRDSPHHDRHPELVISASDTSRFVIYDRQIVLTSIVDARFRQYIDEIRASSALLSPAPISAQSAISYMIS